MKVHPSMVDVWGGDNQRNGSNVLLSPAYYAVLGPKKPLSVRLK